MQPDYHVVARGVPAGTPHSEHCLLIDGVLYRVSRPSPRLRGLGDRIAHLLKRLGITPASWSKASGGYCIIGGGMTARIAKRAKPVKPLRQARQVEPTCGCQDRQQLLNRLTK